MKQIVIIMAAAGEQHDLTIQPGTTASDILSQLGLEGYELSKDNGQYRTVWSRRLFATNRIIKMSKSCHTRHREVSR